MAGSPPHGGGKRPIIIYENPPKISGNVEESTDLNQVMNGTDTSSSQLPVSTPNFYFPSLEELDQILPQYPQQKHQIVPQYQQQQGYNQTYQQELDQIVPQYPQQQGYNQLQQHQSVYPQYQEQQGYNQTHQQMNASSYQFPDHRQDPAYFQDPMIPFQHPPPIQMQGSLSLSSSSSSSQSELLPLPLSYSVEDSSQGDFASSEFQFPCYQQSHMEDSIQGTLSSFHSELPPLPPSNWVEDLSQGSYSRPVYQYPDPNLNMTHHQMHPPSLSVNVPPVSQPGNQHAVPPSHNSRNKRLLNMLAREFGNQRLLIAPGADETLEDKATRNAKKARDE